MTNKTYNMRVKRTKSCLNNLFLMMNDDDFQSDDDGEKMLNKKRIRTLFHLC